MLGCCDVHWVPPCHFHSGSHRFQVHFTHNAGDLVRCSAASTGASAIRRMFGRPVGVSARERLDRVVDSPARAYPRRADLVTSAEPDRLECVTLPGTYRSRSRRTNPLDRLGKAVKPRTGVVGTFPDPQSVNRLVGMAPAEQDDT